MTLSVSAYIIAPDGSTTDIPLPSDLAGFESARRNFYGAASQKYGLNLLSQLQDFTLLEVRGELLNQLLSEVEVLLNDTALDESGDYWRFRLNNIKTAAEVALKYGDVGAISIGQPNFVLKWDNAPSNYCSLFDDSEVISGFSLLWGVTP